MLYTRYIFLKSPVVICISLFLAQLLESDSVNISLPQQVNTWEEE